MLLEHLKQPPFVDPAEESGFHAIAA